MGYISTDLSSQKNMSEFRKAYSYIRFSTPEQQAGDSFRRQYELSKAYAKKKNLILDENLTYKDLGVSAFNKSNIRVGQLGKFLEAVESGNVPRGSVLLIESLDRLSRAQVSDAFGIFSSILSRGITIVTLSDEMEYSQEKANQNFTDLIVSIVYMSRAHDESLMKSKRLKESWMTKRKNIADQKLTSKCPGWLKLSEDRKTFIPIPERVEVIKKIFEWSKNGIGSGGIAKRLNQDSVPVFMPYSKMWHISYVNRVLDGRAVLGEFQPHVYQNGKPVPDGDPILNYYPKILTDAEYALAHNARQERSNNARGRKGKTFANVFSGILRCGYCNGAMIFLNRGERGPRSKIIVCSRARMGAGCYYIPWEYDYFEKSVLTYCRGLDFDKFLRPKDGIESKITTLQVRIAEIGLLISENQKKALNIRTAIEDGASYSIFRSRMEQLDQEYESLLADLKNVQMDLDRYASTQADIQAVRASIDSLLEKMNALEGRDLFDMRAMLSQHVKRLVARIVIYPGGYIEKPEHAQKTRENLIESGCNEKRVDNFMKSRFDSAPKVHKRFFTIVSRNESDSIRVIRPDASDPEMMSIQVMQKNSQEGGSKNKDDLVFLPEPFTRPVKFHFTGHEILKRLIEKRKTNGRKDC